MSSSCSQPPQGAQRHLVATSTTVVYEWFTPWRMASGLANIKATLRRRAVTGNFQCQVAYQLAAVRPDKADDPLTAGTTQAGGGEYCTGVVDVSANTASKLWVRFGVAHSLSSGSTPGQADVNLDVSDDACGTVLGTTTLALSTTTTADAFAPVTGFVPALHAAKVKAALVIASLSGNFQCRLCYRVATTSREEPGSWSTTFDQWRSASGEYNKGDLTPSAGNEMYVQFGVQYGLSSGSALGQATVTTTTTGRKA